MSSFVALRLKPLLDTSTLSQQLFIVKRGRDGQRANSLDNRVVPCVDTTGPVMSLLDDGCEIQTYGARGETSCHLVPGGSELSVCFRILTSFTSHEC